ncbi:CK5P3 protein, partial [Leptocoma aspasia]|nr:CK5P3 protein [Leptocoma aspasia]
EDVRQELLAQVQALPSLLSRVGDGASALGDAIELYQACVDFVCDRWGQPWHPEQPQLPKHPPKQLRPLRLERPEPPREAPEPPREDTVSPGGGQGGTEGTAGGPAGRGLGWDTGQDLGAGQGFWVLGCVFGAPIIWGGAELALGPPLMVAPEGVARGPDALTVLENPETRNQFIDELMELELFLAQRLLELEDEADVVAMSQLQLAPAVLQGQSSERVRAQLATVRELLAQLCSRSVQHLCMILASPRC